MCTSRKRKLEVIEEIGLNGLEARQDGMSDEGRDRIDGEEELAAPDWRVRAGAQKQTDTEGKRRARSNTRAVSQTGAHNV